MSWKPKKSVETVVLGGVAEGLEITFNSSMTIRELHEIQKYSEKSADDNMVNLCEVIATKIIKWNYDGVKVSRDALLDLPHDITAEITKVLMEKIVGETNTQNLVEPSQNGLNLEEVSGVMAQE